MTPQRPVSLALTPAGVAALEARGDRPLRVQLELLFSCMIRKRVEFPEVVHSDALPLCLVVDGSTAPAGLEVFFHAVGTRTCAVAQQPIPDLETFPLERVSPFLPRWLSLDYRHGRWRGAFGYAQSPSRWRL